jgi:ABC-type nitrate/sulfonate/bicarbonate transport system permease component
VQSSARAVGERYANWAACLGASQGRILREVILPAVGPDLIGALRLALAAGWGLQVIAELLGSELGVGRLLQVTSQVTATTDLIATLLCLAAAALLLDSLIAAIGKATVRWTE